MARNTRAKRTLDFEGIVNCWPSLPDFCRATGQPDATVRAWIRRDKIPPEHWDGIVAAAGRSRISGISLDSLMAALRISLARERAAPRRASAVHVPRFLHRGSAQ